MQIEDVLRAYIEAELAYRFEERKDLDIAHRSADLGDNNVGVIGCQLADAMFDFVGDVRDDLHGSAEIVASPFGGDDR